MSSQTKVEIFHFYQNDGAPEDAQVIMKLMSVAEDRFVISNVEQNDPFKELPLDENQAMISKVGIGKDLSVSDVREIIAENDWNVNVNGVGIDLVYPLLEEGNTESGGPGGGGSGESSHGEPA